MVAAPAVDVRLPWARWQQPVGLLQIGAALRARNCDVRLIDCLQVPSDGHLPREHVGRLEVADTTIGLWRFGLSPAKAIARLRAWAREGWRPERVLVSCGLSTWWQGARDVIAALRTAVEAPLTLGGAYPTFCPDHAAVHAAADAIVIGDLPEARDAIPDLSLYRPGPMPRFAAIHLLGPSGSPTAPRLPRSSQDVAAEVAAKAALGVTTFAFFDDWLGPEHYQPLTDALSAVVALSLPKAGFAVVGNFSPRLIDEDLAQLLRRANFRQVYLHDDVAHAPCGIRHLSSEGDYRRCVRALHRAGFPPRTDRIGASVLVGVPSEDLAVLSEHLASLASIVGSVNLVPFQYTPGTPEGNVYEQWLAQRNGHFDPTMLNAQLYPLARLAGADLEDYRELTRMAALLNTKFHSRTFDFLGRGLTARLVRASLHQELWNLPSESASSGVPLPHTPGRQQR